MTTETKWLRFCLAATVMFAVAACAPRRPVFYPNDHLRSVGEDRAQTDVQQCLELARDYVPEEAAASQTAKQTAGGAAVGAVVGTAVGAAAGNTGRGAAIGAAGGGTRGLIRGLSRSREPEPVTKRFVDQCLSERGYRVIGWK